MTLLFSFFLSLCCRFPFAFSPPSFLSSFLRSDLTSKLTNSTGELSSLRASQTLQEDTHHTALNNLQQLLTTAQNDLTRTRQQLDEEMKKFSQLNDELKRKVTLLSSAEQCCAEQRSRLENLESSLAAKTKEASDLDLAMRSLKVAHLENLRQLQARQQAFAQTHQEKEKEWEAAKELLLKKEEEAKVGARKKTQNKEEEQEADRGLSVFLLKLSCPSLLFQSII